MTITRQIQINCKTDTCCVAKSATGAITIGSVRIQPDEVEDFVKTLQAAVAILEADPTPTP